MPAERVLIAANRLPVSAHAQGNAIELAASSGGLATGLRPWHERRGALWFGWPCDLAGASDAQRAALDQRLYAGGMVPVHLSSEQVAGYYHGFANRVLWPLFHYSIDRVPVDAAGWAAYKEVNAA